MRALPFISVLILFGFAVNGQSYTSYFTGNDTDYAVNGLGGVCLMGGATEDDDAIKWFLERANGGDVLVLRTSGSDGYNDYLFSELGVSVNSVETIKCNSAEASYDPYVLMKVAQAEAIWFAGGNQWNYVSYWRNTPVDSLINLSIKERDIVIGGTSAGMAIQSQYYFSAENGTVTSDEALADPYRNDVTVDSTPFIENEFLQNVITDTHYDDPDRKGRHVVFLARMLTDHGISPRGIACDEYTAVCIDQNGIASVFGKHPSYDDNAYFIQPNCELDNYAPENCSSGSPLIWNLESNALKVYAVKGTSSGSNTFDLKDWQTGEGGEWQTWYVENGNLVETEGEQINCNTLSVNNTSKNQTFTLSPNPALDQTTLICTECVEGKYKIEVYDSIGKLKHIEEFSLNNQFRLDVSKLPIGVYSVKISRDNTPVFVQKLHVIK